MVPAASLRGLLESLVGVNPQHGRIQNRDRGCMEKGRRQRQRRECHRHRPSSCPATGKRRSTSKGCCPPHQNCPWKQDPRAVHRKVDKIVCRHHCNGDRQSGPLRPQIPDQAPQPESSGKNRQETDRAEFGQPLQRERVGESRPVSDRKGHCLRHLPKTAKPDSGRRGCRPHPDSRSPVVEPQAHRFELENVTAGHHDRGEDQRQNDHRQPNGSPTASQRQCRTGDQRETDSDR